MTIPDTEYMNRIRNFQEKMREKEVALAFIYGTDSEPLYLRYLTNYWPNFETGSLLVPQEGEPTLLTGPEMGYYVRSVSPIRSIKKVYELKELSSPKYNDEQIFFLGQILKEFISNSKSKRLGIVGEDIIPHNIWKILAKYKNQNEIISLDQDLIDLKAVKSPVEQDLLRKSFRIAEDAFDEILQEIKPGMTEAEVTALVVHIMASKGAEAPSYSLWCASGPNSKHVIHRNTTRRLKKNELINLGIGCRVDGYCSSIGRSIVFGKLDKQSGDLVKDATEIGEIVMESLVVESNAGEVAEKIASISIKKGHSAIYGPAHSTGLVECENPWVEKGASYKLKTGMVFNVDIWLENECAGTRYENGLIVKEGESEKLSGRRTGLIRL